MSTIVAKTGTRNWSTDSDWVGEAQPAAGDTAVIPAGCTMNGEVIAANILVIVEQGGELDLWAMMAGIYGIILCYGTLYCNGMDMMFNAGLIVAKPGGNVVLDNTMGYDGGTIICEGGGQIEMMWGHYGGMLIEAGGLVEMNYSWSYTGSIIVEDGGALSWSTGDGNISIVCESGGTVTQSEVTENCTLAYYDGATVTGSTKLRQLPDPAWKTLHYDGQLDDYIAVKNADDLLYNQKSPHMPRGILICGGKG